MVTKIKWVMGFIFFNLGSFSVLAMENPGQQIKTRIDEIKEEASSNGLLGKVGNPEAAVFLKAAAGERNNDADVVRHYIEDYSLNTPDYFARGPENFSALHIAAKHGKEAIVRLLLESPYVNKFLQPADYNISPLHLAAAFGHVGVVKILLDHEKYDTAQIKAKADNNLSALYFAVEKNNGNQEVLKLLLESSHVQDLMQPTHREQENPLHWAIRSKNIVMAEALLQSDFGAQLVSQRNRYNYLPLFQALLVDAEIDRGPIFVKLLLSYFPERFNDLYTAGYGIPQDVWKKAGKFRAKLEEQYKFALTCSELSLPSAIPDNFDDGEELLLKIIDRGMKNLTLRRTAEIICNTLPVKATTMKQDLIANRCVRIIRSKLLVPKLRTLALIALGKGFAQGWNDNFGDDPGQFASADSYSETCKRCLEDQVVFWKLSRYNWKSLPAKARLFTNNIREFLQKIQKQDGTY